MELIDLDECSRFNGTRECWINSACDAVMNKEQAIMFDNGKTTISFYSVIDDLQEHVVFTSLLRGLLGTGDNCFQHRMRATAEAILIGQLTQLADDYEIGSVLPFIK